MARNGTSADESIVQEAQDNFHRCEEWEADFRKLFVEDLKFANGDSDNNYQWPDTIRNERDGDDKPCLTVNKTKIHCFQIINDSRQHAPQIKVRPVNSGATVEAAKLMDGLVRHVEYQSNAQSAYNTMQEFAVFGGIGYLRVTTDYVSDDSFDQEIFINRIKDPLTVYLDPDIKEVDGSDAKFGFVFTDYSRAEFTAKYGKKAADEAQFPSLSEGSVWLGKDRIRVLEYFRIKTTKEKIAALDAELLQTIPGAKSNVIKESDVDPEIWDAITQDPGVKLREVEKKTVEWYMIAGNKIKDRSIWPGQYIPIVRCVGEEVVIDGKLERKGHVRTLKDPQRMYNFWTSSATEHVALQTKIPYVAGKRAIKGYEKYWDGANTENYPYLPYNDIDDIGNPITRPQREQPPVMAQAYIEGMKIAASEMMMVSGQYQAVMGQPSNETSGVAINARQRQGDNATYHFIDHQAAAVRFVGRIVVDLFPHVYDTPRLIRVLGEDGIEDFIHIDPDSQQALVKQKVGMANEVKQILNPSVGKYGVIIDVGPAYATRRQEAFAAMSQIMAQNSELMDKAGDLLFKAADFPMAQDIAERLNRAIPQALKGDGPTPEMARAQEHINQLQQALQMMSNELTKLKDTTDATRARAGADVYRAETDRIELIHKSATDQTRLAHEVALAVTQMQQAQGAPQIPDPASMAPPAPMPNTTPPAGGFLLPNTSTPPQAGV